MEDNNQMTIVWRNVVVAASLHMLAVYGIYLCFFKAYLMTGLIWYFFAMMGGLGVTAGAHRLWAHKAYKARLPLRILLVLFNSIAVQNSVLEWARDHRMHHRHSETDADPHNAKRGFFFSHIGWLMVKKHPDIKAKAHTIDMSDLQADPVLRWQKKYYLVLVAIVGIAVPIYIPTLWGETLWNSFFISFILRYIMSLHYTWLVNSAAHMWGNRPYDQSINPAENNFVSLCSLGEGFHNYHHTFPWDYKTAELGYFLNVTTLFIDAMSVIGWAYDLKSVPPEVVKNRSKRMGTVIYNEGQENTGYQVKGLKLCD